VGRGSDQVRDGGLVPSGNGHETGLDSWRSVRSQRSLRYRPEAGSLDFGRLTSMRVGMNDPEVTMSNAVANGQLGARQPGGRARPLGAKSPAPLGIADASATEVDSHLRLLAAAGAVHDIEAKQALESFDQVRAMTWRLLNPL
jgi:hypothetical protein